MKRYKFTVATGTPEDLALVTASREYRACSDQQKRFVLDLLTTGDARHALEVAYPKATVASRRSLQWQVLRAEAVVNVLEFWKWRDTENARAKLIEICRAQLAACEPGSIAAQRFAVQLERLILGLIPIGRRPIVDEDEPAADSQQPGQQTVKNGNPDSRVPPGATPLVDAQGIVRGFKTGGGDYVQLADVEVSR